MKGTEHFKKTIQDYLDNRAKSDTVFAVAYGNSEKSIDECINYIFKKVLETGCNGFENDEIFGFALHYYDEIDLTIDKDYSMRVIVNHIVELTDEEKAEAKEKAVREIINEEKNKLKSKSVLRAVPKAEDKAEQASLF